MVGFDVAAFLLEVRKIGSKYMKKRDKDKYIKILEEKIFEIGHHYSELQKDNEALKQRIIDIENEELNFDKYHLEILSIVDRNDGINSLALKHLYSKSVNYKIAFSELQDKNIIYYAPQNIYLEEDLYLLNEEHRTKVLKALKDNGFE